MINNVHPFGEGARFSLAPFMWPLNCSAEKLKVSSKKRRKNEENFGTLLRPHHHRNDKSINFPPLLLSCLSTCVNWVSSGPCVWQMLFDDENERGSVYSKIISSNFPLRSSSWMSLGREREGKVVLIRWMFIFLVRFGWVFRKDNCWFRILKMLVSHLGW